ncbi:MAG: putative toxin-antitoxin system toxin component, PIN family [Planctomycetes bacterium]|nr:putative toxin-antitoxin system toxin component, PIN family [Planctomycetota bacterium]
MVLDTNVFVSALINPGGLPDQLVESWEADEFTLVTSAEQLDEIERVLAYDKLQRYLRPEQAARLVANLRRLAEFAADLPPVDASTDSSDNLILATAIAGNASHVVTGDKSHLLSLKSVNGVLIVTVREAVALIDAQTGGG